MITKNISALPGAPSTFWSNDNGQHWYLKKSAALAAEEGTDVNPEDYVYKKSFWAQNKKLCIILAVLVVLAITGFILYRKGVLNIDLSKIIKK